MPAHVGQAGAELVRKTVRSALDNIIFYVFVPLNRSDNARFRSNYRKRACRISIHTGLFLSSERFPHFYSTSLHQICSTASYKSLELTRDDIALHKLMIDTADSILPPIRLNCILLLSMLACIRSFIAPLFPLYWICRSIFINTIFTRLSFKRIIFIRYTLN